jgi:phenylpropionate dioxygenase-like ring-hydroxylating dioxygenase large terminal subunit
MDQEFAQSFRKDFVPKNDYISREVAQLENERLWGSVWLMACREQQLQNPGDYVVFDIASESILPLRRLVAGPLRAR